MVADQPIMIDMSRSAGNRLQAPFQPQGYMLLLMTRESSRPVAQAEMRGRQTGIKCQQQLYAQQRHTRSAGM